MGRESFCTCFLLLLLFFYAGTSEWNALPMVRESLFSCFVCCCFTLGRQDGMVCLWPVSRFVLGFCWGFVCLDVRMESFAYGS